MNKKLINLKTLQLEWVLKLFCSACHSQLKFWFEENDAQGNEIIEVKPCPKCHTNEGLMEALNSGNGIYRP